MIAQYSKMCRAKGAVVFFCIFKFIFHVAFFSVAAKDGPLPLAAFPPSCHHKRGLWPTSGMAELPQFNPNLKDKLYNKCFWIRIRCSLVR